MTEPTRILAATLVILLVGCRTRQEGLPPHALAVRRVEFHDAGWESCGLRHKIIGDSEVPLAVSPTMWLTVFEKPRVVDQLEDLVAFLYTNGVGCSATADINDASITVDPKLLNKARQLIRSEQAERPDRWSLFQFYMK